MQSRDDLDYSLVRDRIAHDFHRAAGLREGSIAQKGHPSVGSKDRAEHVPESMAAQEIPITIGKLEDHGRLEWSEAE